MAIITEQSPLMFNDALPAAVDVVVSGAGVGSGGSPARGQRYRELCGAYR